MKKLLFMLLLSLLTTPVFAQVHYIADDLFTYMHSGPSNQYRIIGSINAGEKVQLLKTNKETGYSEILDNKGRQGWVQDKFITTTESMASRLPRLEKELKNVKGQLADAEKNASQEKAGLVESLEVRNKQISELEENYSGISEKLATAQSEIRELRAKLDTQKEDLLMKYFMYGGGVALGGILLGIILPHLIPRRKKSHSNWL
ncbi:SH3 domain-containing protein [Vibrio ruber DSM 16370]|uniref:SH3 domain-containing protein n=1 Tax=Vibrio ruber (strain DSM 16370 / JCM 11486 / BCRC 17186 / CECT 7878 / LMG 23124 / VR1) TaxID=1123498 RepID=A0A1R4L948_VIBR1|nr:TIGR04211 family SH3 domain-containing protein [Vibrio ruber]SJN53120.1 SH3 domain-containing protein [Vibrio ruber DSM 16370]